MLVLICLRAVRGTEINPHQSSPHTWLACCNENRLRHTAVVDLSLHDMRPHTGLTVCLLTSRCMRQTSVQLHLQATGRPTTTLSPAWASCLGPWPPLLGTALSSSGGKLSARICFEVLFGCNVHRWPVSSHIHMQSKTCMFSGWPGYRE